MRMPDAKDDSQGPNLTPLIDVVFLLLIFFLVATRFDQQEREISTKLAEVLEAQPLAMGPKEVVVNIDAQGKYVVMQEEMTEEMLADMLHTVSVKNPETKVQIRADQDVKFRYPAAVMGMCERDEIDHFCTVLQKR